MTAEGQYLLKRALDSDLRAKKASHPAAEGVHRTLAREYRDRACEAGIAPIDAPPFFGTITLDVGNRLPGNRASGGTRNPAGRSLLSPKLRQA